jgi:succinoglycan biosynthesis protein ExoA
MDNATIDKKISIIIPTAPGNYPKGILSSLEKVEYPKNLMEIIIVEGKQPAHQRNEAIRRASNDTLLFFDDDVTLKPDIIKHLVKHFVDKKVAVVGGPNLTPSSDSRIQRYFGYAMSCPWVSGQMSNRYKNAGEVREADEKDLILCNLSARKSVLEKEGNFKECLWPNEENELFVRLSSRGYKLIYEPEAIVYHSRRSNLKSFIKQLFGYGRGRAEQILIQPSSLQSIFLIPSLLLLYTLSIPIIGLLPSLSFIQRLIYSTPLALYILYSLFGALETSLKEGEPAAVLWLIAIFPTVHYSYGLGFLKGFFNKVFRNQRKDLTSVKVTVLEPSKP